MVLDKIVSQLELNNMSNQSKKIISYCIPIMNRMDDLKATLSANLSILREFSSAVEIHVACFDDTNECADWVGMNFSEDIRSGLLNFHKLMPLPYWHFCWAKNSFRNIIESKYYSSLDGDNFLSRSEVEKTLDIVNRYGDAAAIHHFSGTWGDGTSGRLTIPTHLYRKYGYINELFPRQFDELGLLLNILNHERNLIYVVRPGVDVIKMSSACADFCRLNELHVSKIEEDQGIVPPPLRPRGVGYVSRDKKFKAFDSINKNYALLRASSEEEAKAHFSRKLKETQNELAHDEVLPSLLGFMFDGPGLSILKKSGALTVYSVIKDDEQFLSEWYRHYKKQGVDRFIIVDDVSDTPIESVLKYPDVFVLRPRVGDFRAFKVFWLMALMNAFQEPDSWVVTVDSDEFVDMPNGQKGATIAEFVHSQPSKHMSWIPGVLVEMMPDSSVEEINAFNFREKMNSFYFRPLNESYGYQNFPPVKWAFGDKWSLSFGLDLRWRLFGTHDCLRKFPVVRYTRGVTLHQGFHAIYKDGKEMAIGSLATLLAVRHYKMYKVLSVDFDVKTYQKKFGSYFSRTAANLGKIFSTNPDVIRNAWKLTPFKYRYSEVDVLLKNFRETDD